MSIKPGIRTDMPVQFPTQIAMACYRIFNRALDAIAHVPAMTPTLMCQMYLLFARHVTPLFNPKADSGGSHRHGVCFISSDMPILRKTFIQPMASMVCFEQIKKMVILFVLATKQAYCLAVNKGAK
ncbi:hypothetical protein LPB41_23050 [Thalassospira sp. MA62]|nr:hypothetical protein [Thalassospira sp. MA62]